MAAFPLQQIPYGSTIRILEKMSFREGTRMRRTCRRMDELIANAKTLSFLVPEGLELEVTTYPCLEGMKVVVNILKYECPFAVGMFPFRYLMATVDHSMPINGMTVPSNRLLPRQLESARFRTLTIWIGSLNHYNYTIPPDFFSFFDEIKPRCQRLKYKPDRDSQDLGPLNIVKMFRPSCVHYAQTSPLFYYRFPVYQIPMAFDSLRQLAALGVKQVRAELCDCVPPDYAQVLSKYECVNIDSVVAESTLSLAPLVQLLLTDPNTVLSSFQLPAHGRETLLSPGEIEELALHRGRVQLFDGQIVIKTPADDLFTLQLRPRGISSCTALVGGRQKGRRTR